MSTQVVLTGAALALGGVLLSSLFSGLETGVYTLNRVRLAVLRGRGDSTAGLLGREIDRPTRMLSTLLIGNNLANYLSSLGIAALFNGLDFTQWGTILLNAVVLTPILFVFGEVLPKDLFRTHADRWAYRWAPFLTVARWLFTVTLVLPLVQSVGALLGYLVGATDEPLAARQRISRLIKEGVGAGLLSESQTTLADRALSLRSRRVADEMVPWSQVQVIDGAITGTERSQVIAATPYTRLPVVRGSGETLGVLSVLDPAIDHTAATESLMRDRFDLDPEMPVVAALRLMRQKHQKFAIVTDPPTGRPLGIVTMKDLVEPLTGELAAW